MSNSDCIQPQTMLSPARPLLIWSIVAMALATNTGCTNGRWTVAKTEIPEVSAERPAAKVKVSSDLCRALVAPP